MRCGTGLPHRAEGLPGSVAVVQVRALARVHGLPWTVSTVAVGLCRFSTGLRAVVEGGSACSGS